MLKRLRKLFSKNKEENSLPVSSPPALTPSYIGSLSVNYGQQNPLLQQSNLVPAQQQSLAQQNYNYQYYSSNGTNIQYTGTGINNIFKGIYSNDPEEEKRIKEEMEKLSGETRALLDELLTVIQTNSRYYLYPNGDDLGKLKAGQIIERHLSNIKFSNKLKGILNDD